MDPYYDESDGDVYDNTGIESVIQDREVLSRGDQALGISIDYVPDWKPPHALREFFQNWKDAIIETSSLKQTNFKVVVKGFDAKDVYIAEARHPETGQLLGFIKLQKGLLEFTNFRAHLPRKALNLGVSTKRKDTELAGTHGEGLKVAALVMVREGYRVRYESSDYYWNFKFKGRYKDQFYCSLLPMNLSKLGNLMEGDIDRIMGKKARLLESHIWEDVSVKIGKLRGTGNEIDKAEFVKWINVSLDLDNPSRIIYTKHGSLILDPRFKGRIYLKGLLLEAKTSTNDFKFGYNFLDGEVNRDRQRLTNPNEEARMLTRIWDASIHKEEVILDLYINTLQQEDCADTNLAENFISEGLAQKIWLCMRARDPKKRKFYHDDRNGDRDVELIKCSLKKVPVQLTKRMWDILRKYKLVRTPQEQQHYVLYNAPVSTMEETPYAASVERALMAALALDPRTKDLQIVFKSGVKAELNLLLHENQLLIHDRWRDFNASHSVAPCWLSRLATNQNMCIDTFSCDHVITELYGLVLAEVAKAPAPQAGVELETDSSLRLKVSESLRQMPRNIKMTLSPNPGEIIVSWTDMESEMTSAMHNFIIECRVTLHRLRTCPHKRLELLTPDFSKETTRSIVTTVVRPINEQYTAECGCPEQLVPQKDFKAKFHTLSHNEKYVPSVSRTDAGAFYGLPPPGMQPKAPEVYSPNGVHRMTNATPCSVCSHSGFLKSEEVDDTLGNLYDGDSDSNGDMDLDNPSSSSRASSVTFIPQIRPYATPTKNRDQSKQPKTTETVSKKLRKNPNTAKQTIPRLRDKLVLQGGESRGFKLKLKHEHENALTNEKQYQPSMGLKKILDKFLLVQIQKPGVVTKELEQEGNEMTRWQAKLTTKDEQISTLNSKILALEQQLITKSEDHQEANTVIQTYFASLSNLKTDLETANSRNSQLEVEIREANHKIARLYTTIHGLHEENRNLMERLEQVELDLTEQIRIFSRQDARRKLAACAGVKRERLQMSEDVGDREPGDGSVKRRKLRSWI